MILRAVDAMFDCWAVASLDYEHIHVFLVTGHHSFGDVRMTEYDHMTLPHIYLSRPEVDGHKRSVTIAVEEVDAEAPG